MMSQYKIVPSVIAVVLITAVLCGAVFAQDSTSVNPTIVPETELTKAVVIQEGVILKVSTLDALSSNTSKQGDIFRMKLDDELKISNLIAIPAGAIAYGTITYAEPRRMLGQPGELYYRVDYIKHGEQRIKIRTSRSAQGKDSNSATFALVALFGVFGAFKKGKDIEVPVGTSFEVYVSETITISL